MNQIDTIKALLVKYTQQCAAHEMNDAAKAAAYVEAHKPPGVGRVNPVIIQPILGEVRQAHWDRVFHREPEAPAKPAIALGTSETVKAFAVGAPKPMEGINFVDDTEEPVAIAQPKVQPKKGFFKRLLGGS